MTCALFVLFAFLIGYGFCWFAQNSKWYDWNERERRKSDWRPEGWNE